MFQKTHLHIALGSLFCAFCSTSFAAELDLAELRRSSPSFVAQLSSTKISQDEKLESFSVTPMYRGKFEGSVSTSTRLNEDGRAVLRLNSIYPIPQSGVSFLVELKTNKLSTKQEVVFKPDSEVKIVKIKSEVPASAVKQVRKNLYTQATVKVEPGMNLRRLAMRYSRSAKGEKFLPTVAQSMAVIFLHNPDSFDDRNPDKMMKGFEVNIPAQTTLMSFPHDKALAFLDKARAASLSNDQIKTAKNLMVDQNKALAASKEQSPSNRTQTSVVQENKPATVKTTNKGVSEVRLVDQTEPEPIADNRKELAKIISLSTEKDKLLNQNPEHLSSAQKSFNSLEEKVSKAEGIFSLRANENINLLKGNGVEKDKTPVFIDSKTQDYGPEYAEARPNNEDPSAGQIDDKNIEIVQSEDQVKYQYAEKIDISENNKIDKADKPQDQGFFNSLEQGFDENKAYVIALLSLILTALSAQVGYLIYKRRKSVQAEQDSASNSDSSFLDKTPSSFQAASNAFSMGLKEASSRPLAEPQLNGSDLADFSAAEEDEESFSQVEKQKVDDTVEVASLKDRFMMDRKVIQREGLEYGYDPAPVEPKDEPAPLLNKQSKQEPVIEPDPKSEPLLKEFVSKEPKDDLMSKSVELSPEQEAAELSRVMFGSNSPVQPLPIAAEKEAYSSNVQNQSEVAQTVDLNFSQTEFQMRKEGATDKDLGLDLPSSDVIEELQALGGDSDSGQLDDDLDTRIELANAYIEMEDFESATSLMKGMRIADKSKLTESQTQGIRAILDTIKGRAA